MLTRSFQFIFYTVLIYSNMESMCVTVNRLEEDFTSDIKVELKPLFITCGLEDIIVLSAPRANNEAIYYLNKPNGDTVKLDIKKIKDKQYGSRNNAEKRQVKSYRIFNVNRNVRLKTSDIFAEEEGHMRDGEFMIGPLQHEDHGNWVLSAYYNENGEFKEMFQVISIEIIEFVPVFPTRPKLTLGANFEFRFAYPIRNLESCELRAPSTTFDRYYDRDRNNMDSCGYTVTNVTKEDQGVWGIIGVANIVYETNVYLEIIDVT